MTILQIEAATKTVLILQNLPHIGRKTILRHFDIPDIDPSIGVIDELLYRARAKSKRIGKYTTKEIEEAVAKAEAVIDNCNKTQCNIVSFMTPEYPEQLKNISDPPVLLYYKGNFTCLQNACTIAIIGTRAPTEYGYRIGVRVGELIAKEQMVSISGLAVGCDTSGHMGSLKGGGKTVAVLANGLETIYPASNKKLAAEILSSDGCLISEYPPFCSIQKGNFIERDRLQAGLSDAVFVVQTGIHGGTMHTVRYAQAYNRRIYCYSSTNSLESVPLQEEGNRKLIADNTATAVSNRKDFACFLSQVKALYNMRQSGYRLT